MNRLWVKLSLAFLAIALAAIGVVAVVSARATGEQFRRYVVASGMMGQQPWAETLTEYYATHRSWDGVDALLAQLSPGANRGMGRGRSGGSSSGTNLAGVVTVGRVLASLTGELVGVVLPVNAFVVVVFQYFVGKRIRPDNIQKLMFYGTLFFMAGLAGFMISGDNLLLWGVSAAVFTIGELIFAPGEYMLVDNIAPPGLKASYFSAQQLGWLGGACNPLFTGLMLTWMPPFMLFVVLMVAILLAYLMVVKGIAVKPQRVMA